MNLNVSLPFTSKNLDVIGTGAEAEQVGQHHLLACVATAGGGRV
jgi:hypothetical protein